MFIVQRWLPPASSSRQSDLWFAGQPPVPAQRVRPPEHCAKSQVIFALVKSSIARNLKGFSRLLNPPLFAFPPVLCRRAWCKKIKKTMKILLECCLLYRFAYLPTLYIVHPVIFLLSYRPLFVAIMSASWYESIKEFVTSILWLCVGKHVGNFY